MLFISGAGLHYDPSKTYSYVYETDVEVNDVNSPKTSRPYKDVGVKLFINFQLSTLYKNAEVQLFKLVVSDLLARQLDNFLDITINMLFQM